MAHTEKHSSWGSLSFLNEFNLSTTDIKLNITTFVMHLSSTQALTPDLPQRRGQRRGQTRLAFFRNLHQPSQYLSGTGRKELNH